MAETEKRKSKGPDYWRRVIEEWIQSGKNQKTFCESREISLTAFRWWRHKLLHAAGSAIRKKPNRPKASSPHFIPIGIKPDRSSLPQSSIDLFLPGDRRLRISPGFDAVTLKQLLEVLEEASC